MNFAAGVFGWTMDKADRLPNALEIEKRILAEPLPGVWKILVILVCLALPPYSADRDSGRDRLPGRLIKVEFIKPATGEGRGGEISAAQLYILLPLFSFNRAYDN